MCLPLKLIARQASKNVDGVVIKLRVSPPFLFSVLPLSASFTALHLELFLVPLPRNRRL